MSDIAKITDKDGILGKIVIASIPPDVDLYKGISEVCDKHGINFGVLISAIGSLKRINFDNGDITYEGPCALIGAQGYVGKTKTGELVTHVHCSARAPAITGSSGQILIAGNLNPGNPALYQVEIAIVEVEGITMTEKGVFAETDRSVKKDVVN